VWFPVSNFRETCKRAVAKPSDEVSNGSFYLFGSNILFERNILKKVGITFIVCDKSNSGKSFWMMGCERR